MITIKSIGYKRGYSGEDHNLSDYELNGLVGRSFANAQELFRAANKLASGPGKTAPIEAEVLFADGDTRWVSE